MHSLPTKKQHVSYHWQLLYKCRCSLSTFLFCCTHLRTYMHVCCCSVILSVQLKMTSAVRSKHLASIFPSLASVQVYYQILQRTWLLTDKFSTHAYVCSNLFGLGPKLPPPFFQGDCNMTYIYVGLTHWDNQGGWAAAHLAASISSSSST